MKSAGVSYILQWNIVMFWSKVRMDVGHAVFIVGVTFPSASAGCRHAGHAQHVMQYAGAQSDSSGQGPNMEFSLPAAKQGRAPKASLDRSLVGKPAEESQESWRESQQSSADALETPPARLQRPSPAQSSQARPSGHEEDDRVAAPLQDLPALGDTDEQKPNVLSIPRVSVQEQASC